MDAVCRLLGELVSIPSVNPVCDPAGTGEGAVAGFLADHLRNAGLDVELREVAPGRPNLLATLTPRRRTGRVLLAPHLDTVTVQGMQIDPYAADVRDGRLYGRGAADTKGSVAAFAAALERLASSAEYREGAGPEVVLAALMGEESGNDGAEALLADGVEADFAVAGEPTSLKVVHGHRGALWLRLVTHGVSAHGSLPDRGRNAVWAMSRILDRLRDEWIPALRAVDAPDPPTLSLGMIRGGHQVNVIPDRCEIRLDWRTIPGDHAEDLVARLRAMAAETAGDEARPEVEIMRDRPPLATDPADPWAVRLAAAAGAEGVQDGAMGTAPWLCDASLFAAAGIPAVAFGPGESGEAHTARESVALDEVARASRIIERFILNLPGGDRKPGEATGR